MSLSFRMAAGEESIMRYAWVALFLVAVPVEADTVVVKGVTPWFCSVLASTNPESVVGALEGLRGGSASVTERDGNHFIVNLDGPALMADFYKEWGEKIRGGFALNFSASLFPTDAEMNRDLDPVFFETAADAERWLEPLSELGSIQHDRKNKAIILKGDHLRFAVKTDSLDVEIDSEPALNAVYQALCK